MRGAKKDQLLIAGSLISGLGAVKGNRGIAVLQVRVVCVWRETENKTLSVVSVMADGL